MICVIVYYTYSTLYLNDFSFKYEENTLFSDDFVQNTITNASNLENTATNTIVVYICGAVKETKVITLNEIAEFVMQ